MPTTLNVPERIAMMRSRRPFQDFAPARDSLAPMRLMSEDSVSAWNALYPPGTPVKVYAVKDDESSAFESVTTSAAWLVGGSYAIVSIQGRAGGYALAHVKPLIGQAATSRETVTVEAGKGVEA